MGTLPAQHPAFRFGALVHPGQMIGNQVFERRTPLGCVSTGHGATGVGEERDHDLLVAQQSPESLFGLSVVVRAHGEILAEILDRLAPGTERFGRDDCQHPHDVLARHRIYGMFFTSPL